MEEIIGENGSTFSFLALILFGAEAYLTKCTNITFFCCLVLTSSIFPRLRGLVVTGNNGDKLCCVLLLVALASLANKKHTCTAVKLSVEFRGSSWCCQMGLVRG